VPSRMAEEGIVHSFLARIAALLLALPLGIALSLAAVVVLFSNEGRAVKTRRNLAEGAAIVVSVSPDRVGPANDGRLVHVQGQVSTEEVLKDPVFTVATRALRLRRTVEMYQWNEREENRRDASGKQSTSYIYDKKWSSGIIDASQFHQGGYENPKSMPYTCQEWSAQVFTLGAFRLGAAARDEVVYFSELAVTNTPREVAKAGFNRLQYSFYRGANQLSPQIGDVRVAFEHVEPQEITVIAAQQGDTLQPYTTKNGGTIAMVSKGYVPAAEMFRDAQWWNEVKTWLIRIGGVFLMVFGFHLMLRPIAVLDNLLPSLLPWISIATGFLGFFLAIATALVVTSLAWVAYRPVIAIPLLITGVLIALLILAYGRRGTQPAV
jgi:hypothetical protein